MNEIIKSLYTRKSCRVFEEKPVSQEIKQTLLETSLQAPTAGNQVMYSIIDVTDSDLKLALSKSCDNQPFIAKAPLVFVFVADMTRWIRGFELNHCQPRPLGVGDLMLAASDTLIAAQNMVVAGESLGLGSCYIGDILENCSLHREMLQLPEHCLPVAMLVLGYPTKQQQERPKPKRFDMKYVVGENAYPQFSDEEIMACFDGHMKERNPNLPLEESMKAFCNRKYNSEFSLEMTRSVKEYLQSFES